MERKTIDSILCRNAPEHAGCVHLHERNNKNERFPGGCCVVENGNLGTRHRVWILCSLLLVVTAITGRQQTHSLRPVEPSRQGSQFGGARQQRAPDNDAGAVRLVIPTALSVDLAGELPANTELPASGSVHEFAPNGIQLEVTPLQLLLSQHSTSSLQIQKTIPYFPQQQRGTVMVRGRIPAAAVRVSSRASVLVLGLAGTP